MGPALLLGTIALIVARLVLVLPQPGPVVLVDEVGYLTNARVLGGGAGPDFLLTPFYRGGYSLLVAPLTALLESPDSAYRMRSS